MMHSHLPPLWVILVFGYGVAMPVQLLWACRARRTPSFVLRTSVACAPLAVVCAVWVFIP